MIRRRHEKRRKAVQGQRATHPFRRFYTFSNRQMANVLDRGFNRMIGFYESAFLYSHREPGP